MPRWIGLGTSYFYGFLTKITTPLEVIVGAAFVCWELLLYILNICVYAFR